MINKVKEVNKDIEIKEKSINYNTITTSNSKQETKIISTQN